MLREIQISIVASSRVVVVINVNSPVVSFGNMKKTLKTWYNVKMKTKTDELCPMCGEQTVTLELIDHEFEYGCEPNTVMLTVYNLPVRECEPCCFTWLNDEGERIQHKAVCDHLGYDPDEVLAERRRIARERLQNSV